MHAFVREACSSSRRICVRVRVGRDEGGGVLRGAARAVKTGLYATRGGCFMAPLPLKYPVYGEAHLAERTRARAHDNATEGLDYNHIERPCCVRRRLSSLPVSFSTLCFRAYPLSGPSCDSLFWDLPLVAFKLFIFAELSLVNELVVVLH